MMRDADPDEMKRFHEKLLIVCAYAMNQHEPPHCFSEWRQKNLPWLRRQVEPDDQMVPENSFRNIENPTMYG